MSLEPRYPTFVVTLERRYVIGWLQLGPLPEDLVTTILPFYQGNPGPSGAEAGISADAGNAVTTGGDGGLFVQATVTDAKLEHVQAVASATWTINHGLNKYPSVTIIDSANDEVEGSVAYPSTSQIVVTFSAPFSGRAFLN